MDGPRLPPVWPLLTSLFVAAAGAVEPPARATAADSPAADSPAVPAPAVAASTVPASTVAQILDVWRQTSTGPVRLVWTPAASLSAEGDPAQPVSLYGNEWVSPSGPPASAERELLVEGNGEGEGERVQFRGVTWTPREHGHGWITTNQRKKKSTQPPRAIRDFAPERLPQDQYQFHRARFFAAAEAEFLAWRPFLRVVERGTVLDFWPEHEGQYPRATLRAPPDAGSVAWALIAGEVNPTERLTSLDFFAALLATRPDLLESLAGTSSAWTIDPERRDLEGDHCLIVRDAPSEADGVSRALWVDPEHRMRVSRYVGLTPGRRVQIDIRYAAEDRTIAGPAAWTATDRRLNADPGNAFVRSTVRPVDAQAPPETSSVSGSNLPKGCWVVDLRANEQYIRLKNGERRVVTSGEVEWFPTYDELLVTRSGAAGELVETRLRSAQWAWTRWMTIIGGGCLLAAGAAAGVKRFRRGRNVTAAPISAT